MMPIQHLGLYLECKHCMTSRRFSSSSLQLRESLKTGVYVENLSEKVVNNASEAYEVLSSSWMNRKVASTSMNRESSRSHAVFTLQIESKMCKGGMDKVITSSLNLVDLAGSERQKDTLATGLRLKEAGSINKSLSNLGKVIMCLVNVSRDGKKRFIPYRDSKLTFLLRDSLGGNSKTSLIACVHSGYKCYGETLSTLLFAKNAKMIKNKAVLNENSHGNLLKLQTLVKELTAELDLYKRGVQRPISTAEVEVEMPVLKEMFLQAMRLRQVAETEKQDLHMEIEKLRELCDKKDKAIQTNKMIIKFRDNNIKRLSEKMKGQETSSQEEELLKEIEVLRSQVEHHPFVAKHSLEVQRLKATIKSLREDTGVLANIHADGEKICELEEEYHKLLAEQGDKPDTTPQRADMTSTATIEKMRSQMSELEGQVEKLKEELCQCQQNAEKKEKLQDSEIESFKKTVAELEMIISANNMRTKLEKAAINEMHRQTVLTITTPKKERYQLRNRTVVASCDTPDLDISIPFEEPQPTSPVKDEGILGEVFPEEVAQQALLEQIKQLQEQNGSLECRLGEYDTDRVKNLHEITVMKSQIQGTEELLEKEREMVHSLREQLIQFEPKFRAVTEDMENAVGESRDLRLLLSQADKQLREYKEKVKQQELEKNACIEEIESKYRVIEVTMETMVKAQEKIQEEKDMLECYLEVEKESKEFHEDLALQFEAKNIEQDKKIKELEHQIQSAEQVIMEEKDLRESLVNQLSYEGKEKDREMLHQLDENKLLMMEYNSLKNMLEAHEDSADKLRKALEEKDACIVNHEKNIKALEDKVLHYYKTMEDQNDKISELKENLQNVEEQIVFYMEKETSTNEKIENLEEQIKAKEEEIETERKNHTFKVEMLNEDLKSYQENIDELQLEYERSQQQLNLSETNVKNLETKINTLTETLKSKEEASEKLSSKSMELEELTQQLSLLESARQQRTIENIEISNENKELKVKIEEIEKQNNATCTELEFLKTEYQSMKEKTETQTSEISELLRRCSSAELRAANVEADRYQAQSRIMEVESTLEEIRKENSELKELETRLKAISDRDNDILTSQKAELSNIHSNLREIVQWFGLPDGEEFQFDDLLHSIKAMKEENAKLLKETTALVGHSNHKQKIKFHEIVKNENLNLKKDNECLRLKVRHLEHKLSEGKPPHEALRLQKENIVPHHKDFLSGEYTQRSPQYNTLQNREPKK